MSGYFHVPMPPVPPSAPAPIPFLEVPMVLLALGLLGFELVQGIGVIVCANRQVTVNHLMVNENGLRVGVVQKTDGTLELVFDEEELREREGIEVKEFTTRFQQKYAYASLMRRLKAEGYSVVEEVEEADDTIRLVVRRWR